ncbi:MAG TPA: basic amino acid ABC transporter substrate-binding protein [Acidimicrobiales bacterium]|nr:basic amino acid ABC transporter substrate-binding protein [Acidimicrobiales bacterium]
MRTSMVRSVRAAAAVAALLLGVAACGDSDDDGGEGAGPGGLDTVDSGTLTACTDFPYAPFEYEEGGEFVGIDVDIVTAVAGKLDLEASFRDTDFDGIFGSLAAGNCDLVASSVSITDERKETMDFSTGYYEINQSLLVRTEDASRYADLESLAGRTIGVQSGTTGADYAKENAEDATIREFTGADELFTALKAKQVDAVLQDLPVNAYHAATAGDSEVSKVFSSDAKEEYGFAFRQDSDELREAVDSALEELKSDGTYAEILEKYLGEAAGDE